MSLLWASGGRLQSLFDRGEGAPDSRRPWRLVPSSPEPVAISSPLKGSGWKREG